MYDVGVLGLGSMGSMALWQLARRGVKAIGFEQFTIGHDKGGAGGDTRIFRTAYREGSEYVPLLVNARESWRQLERDTGTSILTLNGVATIGEDGHRHVASVIDCVKKCNLDAEILSRDEANNRYPNINVLPGEIAVLDKAGGTVKSELAVTAASSFAEEHGATIMRRTKVTSIEPDATGVWVHTPHADVRVGKLIITGGSWSGDFLNGIIPSLIVPHRLVLTWYLARKPELFHPDVFPVVNRLSKGIDFSVFSSYDANTVKAGLNIDIGPIATADNLPRAVDFSEISRICAAISEMYPGLWPEPIRSTSHTDGFTPDKHAVVGGVPSLSNVVLGVGFSAHGFKMASAIGGVLADLATQDKTNIEIGHLSPSRPAIQALAA